VRLSIKRVALWLLALVLAVFAISFAWNYDVIRRTMLGGLKVYETTPPVLPGNLPRPAILVFSKTNGFRHEEAIPAANALFAELAGTHGWSLYQTENGATFNPAMLARFDAVVFNNVSGDVFTAAQRRALRSFVENGGGFVGVHGAGGDFSYDWRWYVDDLIGAQFIGHPLGPQFQRATVRIADNSHPATQGLPETWSRIDEWYSFAKSVRRPGYHVLAALDEATYSPKGPFGQDLRMGKDHPIAWWHCVGKGRVFYSAMGHQAAAYAEPNYRKMLLGALGWALGRSGDGCSSPAPMDKSSATGGRP
jgi:type 1 glutamine amidotransferase